MTRPEKFTLAAIAAYVLMAVLCFGPATVESEDARRDYLAECRAQEAGDKRRQALCSVGGPMVSDGAAKALFWPLWLSYTVARGVTATQTGGGK